MEKFDINLLKSLFSARNKLRSSNDPERYNMTQEIDVDVMLHNDVHTAEKLLFDEAERILCEPPKYDEERFQKLKQLNELGFTKVGEVQECVEYTALIEKQKAIKDTIEYYRNKNPLNRYISKDAVENVCKKYGLILADVKDYISDIPENKQTEIINFRILHSDTRPPDNWHYDDYRADNYYGRYGQHKIDKLIVGRDLVILAPKHKLNVKNKVIEGHMLKKLKDPIVLQAVYGKKFMHSFYRNDRSADGYLIVSSWGIEAADENVINPLSN